MKTPIATHISDTTKCSLVKQGAFLCLLTPFTTRCRVQVPTTNGGTMKKAEISVNLVRAVDSDTYEIVSTVDMINLYHDFDVVHEKARKQGNMYGYFFVKVPK
jgi:hypothetical protein